MLSDMLRRIAGGMMYFNEQIIYDQGATGYGLSKGYQQREPQSFVTFNSNRISFSATYSDWSCIYFNTLIDATKVRFIALDFTVQSPSSRSTLEWGFTTNAPVADEGAPSPTQFAPGYNTNMQRVGTFYAPHARRWWYGGNGNVMMLSYPDGLFLPPPSGNHYLMLRHRAASSNTGNIDIHRIVLIKEN